MRWCFGMILFLVLMAPTTALIMFDGKREKLWWKVLAFLMLVALFCAIMCAREHIEIIQSWGD